MSVIHTPRKPEINARMISILGVLYLLLVVLFLRLWYFQVVKASQLVERAEASRAQPVLQLAPRGLITDRNGVLIGEIKREIVIKALPSVVAKNPQVIDSVIAILKADPRKLRAKLAEAKRRPYVSSPIFVGATIDAGTKIAESPDRFPGITVDTLPMRSYTDSKSFSHVLGYVWLSNKHDMDRLRKAGIAPAEYVGKSGIERAYEPQLMGQPGAERIEMDAKGHPLRLVGRDEATPGKKLVLTIDANLQKYASAAMAQKHYLGALVAMDPNNGEVLAMVSSPTFDAAQFQGGLTDEEWKAMQSDPTTPQTNRAIGHFQSPGSTFKLVTSLAAYETGKFDPSNRVFCNGAFYLKGKKIVTCLGHHGSLDFKTAMEKSCNTYFATLGFNVGEDALRKAALEMGLGERTGIEIGGEQRGLVPTDHWLKHFKYHWHSGDTVNLSIGQGYVAATPLQMCNLAALVANNGVSYKPHVVKDIVDPLIPSRVTHLQPEISHQVNASPEFWDTLKDALVGVITQGTARTAQIPGIVWGGKTGSTEHGLIKKQNKTHAWFIGMAPMDHPKIVICVLVEDAGHGGDIAAPIAGDVVHHYLVTEAASLAKAASKSTPALAASSASALSSVAPAAR
jgi:penicillin-binding protein 2